MASDPHLSAIRPVVARLCGTIGGVLCLVLATPANAGLESGIAAYKAGSYSVAVQEIEPLAKAGDADAQYYLGAMLEAGLGVDQNYAQATHWYVKASERGLVKAQYHLGLLYETGEGVKKNYLVAAKWYLRAAEQGHAPAQNNLGVLYMRGLGVVKDPHKAYKWISLAVMQRYPAARKNHTAVARLVSALDRAKADKVLEIWRPKPEQRRSPARIVTQPETVTPKSDNRCNESPTTRFATCD